MSVEFNYTREWTDAEAFPLLSFTKNWENPEDYPTIETDEQKVRQDMQSLHDEVKDFLNTELIPRVVAEDATVEAWQAQEEAHAQAEVGRADAEANRVSAETERASAEQERKNAEASRASAELGRSGAEQIRVTSEENRVAAESARVDAENARAAAEQKREDLETGYVAQAKASAESAAQSESNAAQSEENASMSADNAESSAMTAMGYALGGSVRDQMGFVIDFPGTKYYAEVSKAYATGGSFNPDPTGNNVTKQYVDGAENEAAKAQAFAEGGTYKEWEMTTPGQSTLITKTVENGAKQYAEEAERLALAASKSSRDATSSKVAAAESATAAATSATAATNEANRAKAEADRAKDIVGGDYVTREEATSIANTAESNANSYTDQKIADATNTILDVNTGEIQTWDGYTDGLVHSSDRFNNFIYFKVSDATPNAEELGRGIITETTTQGDSTENSDCYLEDFAGVLHLKPSLGYGSVVVIPEGFGGVLIDFYGTPTTFPESGTYFSKDSFYWTSSLKISGYTGFEKTVTIKEELLPSVVVTRDVLAGLEAKVEENTRLANDAYMESQAAYEEAWGVGDELDTHERSNSSHSDIREWLSNVQTTANSKAPMYTYGTTDLTAGSSELATGQLHFVYE